MAEQTEPHGTLWPRLVALALPALLIGAAWVHWTDSPPIERSPEVAMQDEVLARGDARVIVVGNSLALTDIRPAELALGLGLRKEDVARLALPGATAAGWYAMVEQRVIGEGYRPDLLVIVGQMASMVQDGSGGDLGRRLIASVVDKPSPLLDARILGRASGPVALAHQGAFEGHEDAVANLRAWGIGLLFGPTTTDAQAFDVVFGADVGVRVSGNQRMVPGAEATQGARRRADLGLEFLGATLYLARAAGVRTVLVRAPVSPVVRALDEVEPELEAALYRRVNDAGASWIDLHDLELPGGAFRDDYHLNPAAAMVLSERLAERIVDGALLTGGVLPAEAPFRARSVERLGTAPDFVAGALQPIKDRPCGWSATVAGVAGLSDDALALRGFGRTSPLVAALGVDTLAKGHPPKDIGTACTGEAALLGDAVRIAPKTASQPDAIRVRLIDSPSVSAGASTSWWVPPGMALRWSFDAPPEGETPTVTARVRRVVGTGGGELVVAGKGYALVAQERLWTARAPLPAGPFTVEVRADADTWLTVFSLEVDGTSTHRVVGSPWAETPLAQGRPRFSPATTPVVEAPATREEDGVWRLDLPEFSALANDATGAIGAQGKFACSPVEISADGTEFAVTRQTSLAKLRAGEAGIAHEGGWIWTNGDAASPRWWARLNPDRSCRRGARYLPGWLYEGDTASVDVPPRRMAAHPLGPNVLLLDAVAMGADATIHVEVDKKHRDRSAPEWAGDLVVPEGTVRRLHRLIIEPALEGDSRRAVRLSVSGAPLLMFRMSLVEAESL